MKTIRTTVKTSGIASGLLMALALNCALPANAASFPSQPPAPAKAKNFTLPETHTFSLENGLDITFIPYGNTPKTTLVLQFDTGNADDGEATGTADLTFELLNQGTVTTSAAMLAQRASSMGGQIQTSVGMNSSTVSIDVLSEFAEPASQLLAELVTSSAFPETSLQRAIANRWREIQVAQSRAQGQALEAFYSHMYPDHPYGKVYPEKSTLLGINRDHILEFVAEHLVASNAHLYVAGRFDAEALEQKIRDDYALLAAGEDKSSNISVPKVAPPALIRVDRDGAVQTTVRLGQRAMPMADDDYVILKVANTLLGGMFSSRITQNIREDKGYTYSPRSALYSYKNTSVWFEAADIDAPHTAAALNEIIKEIKILQQTPPPAWELKGVQNYMSGLFVLGNSSRTGLISQLINLEVNELPRSRLTNYISLVNKVDADAVSAAASTYLDLDSMSLVVVGDPSLLNTQLQEVSGLPVITEKE